MAKVVVAPAAVADLEHLIAGLTLPAADRVSVVTIQDSRSAVAATGER